VKQKNKSEQDSYFNKVSLINLKTIKLMKKLVFLFNQVSDFQQKKGKKFSLKPVAKQPDMFFDVVLKV